MTVYDLRSGGGNSNYKSGSKRTRAADLGTKRLPGREIDIYLSGVNLFFCQYRSRHRSLTTVISVQKEAKRLKLIWGGSSESRYDKVLSLQHIL